MKFERLRIQGFKSFCEPVELVMAPGLTGVVGPNGCGKSNLVEALRWVMGESSYKAMRASGMEDVIFSGSRNRPGRNSAEVTLVLDNSDRTAPALLNNADQLEVTRRIEREQGSVYRVNGREVRARDVQLLFADASTGAHSPALVRQGQIGQLISAKPVQRRALLEEAAGISGLHSRRHEAELRMKGAEQNLARVDDIIAQVESQLETLKRQSRLAVRYRSISGDIRKAEAALHHVRWVSARVAEKEAEATHGKLVTQLAEALNVESAAQRDLRQSDAAIKPLREAEAAAGAQVQRLKILREQVEAEMRRANDRQIELRDRLTQIDSDIAREAQQIEESGALVSNYSDERAELLKQGESQEEANQTAKNELEAAEATVSECENQHRAAADDLTLRQAQQVQAERGASEAEQRIERLKSQIADVEREAAALTSQLEADQRVNDLRASLDKAQVQSENLEKQVLAAEAQCANLRETRDEMVPRLSASEAEVARLQSEADTLARVLNVGEGGLWAPIIDQLQVEPGFETALGVALGEDLEASNDVGAPIYWSNLRADERAEAFGDGIRSLSDYVTCPSSLTFSLSHIGVVQDPPSEVMLKSLRPGQVLVSKAGDLWRWDGLVAKADAPNAATQRLSQQNRLVELDRELASARAQVEALKTETEAKATELGEAEGQQNQLRESWRMAQQEISKTQKSLDIVQAENGDLTTRRGALEEAKVRLNSSLTEAQDVHADAQKSLSALESQEVAQFKVEALAVELSKLRDAAAQKRAQFASLEQTNQMRQSRIKQLSVEIETWQRRQDNAKAQHASLEERKGSVAQQAAALDHSPSDLAKKREKLDDELNEAEFSHRRSADKLAESETAHRKADQHLRDSSGALADLRAKIAALEERIKGLISARQQIEQTIFEVLHAKAEETARIAEIKPEAALPDEQVLERKVDRLKAERERLGGVNLSAESEMKEVSEKLETMQSDRDDLIEAIAKLRNGISSLNREGRQRLNEAFEKVNAHFQNLFTSLFGGGSAELKFIESDDPLEAGLEIYAQPPGKRTQVLTLLSGGEQALTAMALIFAVFLTNPAPICVLDEVDAPLDDANVERFCDLLDSMRNRTDTRFVVITHNPITMARVDQLFGVTMAERGVSQLVSVDLTAAQAVREAS